MLGGVFWLRGTNCLGVGFLFGCLLCCGFCLLGVFELGCCGFFWWVTCSCLCLLVGFLFWVVCWGVGVFVWVLWLLWVLLVAVFCWGGLVARSFVWGFCLGGVCGALLWYLGVVYGVYVRVLVDDFVVEG